MTSDHQTSGRRHSRRFQIAFNHRRLTPIRTAALTMTASAFLASCASSPTEDPCGFAPASQIRPERATFDDPYNQWRRFLRTSDRFTAASAAGEKADLPGHAWNICRAASALKPYTREVAIEIRPRFVAAVVGIVETASKVAHSTPDVSPTEAGLAPAITELSAAIPRFWLHPAASLRGRMQPGNPLYTHR